jgi:hypothetical protein
MQYLNNPFDQDSMAELARVSVDNGSTLFEKETFSSFVNIESES